MTFLLITIIPQITQKDNSMILLLITIVPQIINGRVVSWVGGSQWSCECKYFEHLEDLFKSKLYITFRRSVVYAFPNYNCFKICLMDNCGFTQKISKDSKISINVSNMTHIVIT